MRYRFLDSIVSLELDGEPRIEVEKTFEPGDDAFSGPAGDARVPESLLLELMAMTGGRLAFGRLGEERLPLLLKIADCRFERAARPGVALRARATLRGTAPVADGASVVEAATEVHDGAGRLAAAVLMYICVRVAGVSLAGRDGRP